MKCWSLKINELKYFGDGDEMTKLLYQGHGSFRIITKNNQVIYVDPFAGDGYDMSADTVLVSHEHGDHSKVDLIKLKTNGKIYRSKDFINGDEYNSIINNGVEITGTPAYNKNHPKNECVGFIIKVDDITIYAAGDTSKTDYMKDVLSQINIDYALLPIDGFYNMGELEASKCAKIIGAKHSIPIHMKPGELFDQEKADAFEAEGKIILKPGMEINI